MKTKISKLVLDEDFETIELELNEPNIFQILSLERQEIRHSNFLAYLFDPNETHGLGTRVLRRFIRSLDLNGQDIDAEQINLEGEIEVRREWRHIDILIVTEDNVILIENKVDSQDGKNQLKRYREIVEENFKGKVLTYIYLTPNRSDPLDANEAQKYVKAGYQDIADSLISILKVFEKSIPERIKMYIQDYITSLNRGILMSDEINRKAMRVYLKHKDAFDFIFSNIPDNSEEKYRIFERYLTDNGYLIGSKNKNWIRFLTPELARLQNEGVLYAEGQRGWPNKEIFLFEVNFTNEDKIEFKATVSPGASDLRTKIVKACEGIEGYRNPQGEKWLVFFLTVEKFTASQLLNKEDDVVKQQLDKLFSSVKPKIELISSAIANALQQNP